MSLSEPTPEETAEAVIKAIRMCAEIEAILLEQAAQAFKAMEEAFGKLAVTFATTARSCQQLADEGKRIAAERAAPETAVDAPIVTMANQSFVVCPVCGTVMVSMPHGRVLGAKVWRCLVDHKQWRAERLAERQARLAPVVPHCAVCDQPMEPEVDSVTGDPSLVCANGHRGPS